IGLFGFNPQTTSTNQFIRDQINSGGLSVNDQAILVGHSSGGHQVSDLYRQFEEEYPNLFASAMNINGPGNGGYLYEQLKTMGAPYWYLEMPLLESVYPEYSNPVSGLVHLGTSGPDLINGLGLLRAEKYIEVPNLGDGLL